MLRVENISKSFVLHNQQGITITPVPLSHSKPCFGYLFKWQGKTFAYLTDTVGLPKNTHAFLKDKFLDLVLMDCNHPPMPESPPQNHNDILLAQSIKQQLTISKMGLIHISHELDCWTMENSDQFSSSFFSPKTTNLFICDEHEFFCIPIMLKCHFFHRSTARRDYQYMHGFASNPHYCGEDYVPSSRTEPRRQKDFCDH
jgi:hypothetical protein